MSDMQPAQEKTGAVTRGETIVVARDVVREFGERRALDGLTFEVRRGECLGLLGPNGAGKTTTLRILSTRLLSTSGHVRVLGLDPARDSAGIRARIGVVPQEIALYDALGARENLDFFARLHGLERGRVRTRVDWALAQAGLEDRAAERVKTFSGGMKRRLNIVASLLHEPELVLLDEPTVGLDPQSRHHVFEMVDRLRAAGVTLVYTTHQLGEVERLCDRIVVLDHGRTLAQGTLAELAQTCGLAGRERVTVGQRSREAAQLLAMHGFAVDVERESVGLEEIFLSLTGRALRDGES
ncbi:MAG: ABC transporter ATP-binding protein [Planctomycetota bacterium]